MGRLVVVLGTVLGGLAFWRRKTLRSDAERVSEAARNATSRVRGGRQALLVELGEAVYTQRTDPEADVAGEIDRLVTDLRGLDDAGDQEESGESDHAEPTMADSGTTTGA